MRFVSGPITIRHYTGNATVILVVQIEPVMVSLS
jgi:hypothetical protein